VLAWLISAHAGGHGGLVREAEMFARGVSRVFGLPFIPLTVFSTASRSLALSALAWPSVDDAVADAPGPWGLGVHPLASVWWRWRWCSACYISISAPPTASSPSPGASWWWSVFHRPLLLPLFQICFLFLITICELVHFEASKGMPEF
jgi:hypothetical protein